MFNFGGMEILVILVVALLVLGPEKLPKFMRTVGKAMGELRRASTEFQRTISIEEAAAEKSLSDETPPAATATGEAAAPASPVEETAEASTAAPRGHKRPPRVFRAKRKRPGRPDADEAENP